MTALGLERATLPALLAPVLPAVVPVTALAAAGAVRLRATTCARRHAADPSGRGWLPHTDVGIGA